MENLYELVAMGKLSAEEYRIIIEGPLNLENLLKAETMTEYCERMEELGAEFYMNPEDSVEVRNHGLLDTEQLTRS